MFLTKIILFSDKSVKVHSNRYMSENEWLNFGLYIYKQGWKVSHMFCISFAKKYIFSFNVFFLFQWNNHLFEIKIKQTPYSNIISKSLFSFNFLY